MRPDTAERAARPAMQRNRSRTARRAILIVPAAVSLLAGLDAGLILLGLPAPVRLHRLPTVHGVLLVLGFVGSLVSLERAVALRHPAGYLAPALLGAGGLLLVSQAPLLVGRGLLTLGSAALVALYVPLWRRQRDDAVVIQALGAVLATGAAGLWAAGVTVPTLLPWLVGFVVLTIGGERLELARVAMGESAGPQLVLISSGLVAAALATLLWPTPGTMLFGAVLLGLTAWLARNDAARRTIRSAGLPRFMAAGMLSGYCWVAAAAAIWLLGGPALEGVRYDAVVHAVFLGFTLSMIMAHAPVILPAVLGTPLPYHPVMVAPLALLHGSLLLRLWLGDAVGSQSAWLVGGALNIVSVLLFAGVVVWSLSRNVGSRA